MRLSSMSCAIVLGVTLVISGLSRISFADEGNSYAAPADGDQSASGPLDGLVFHGALGPDGKAKDIQDVFVFENGTFVSKECETLCKFPARPYFVRVNGAKTEFISETRCPYKDARIIWRGTIEGDRISGSSTWLINRWYWTVEDTFEFEGKLAEKDINSAEIN